MNGIIYELAASEFDLKPTMVKNLIGCYLKYRAKISVMSLVYKDYNFTQLVEMLPLDKECIENNITPNMSVGEIRTFKKRRYAKNSQLTDQSELSGDGQSTDQTTLLDGEKIILDLCGGTGAWSKFYKESGYDVRLVTLPDNDVCNYNPPVNVYGVLAAPPCTEFSLAKGSQQRDFEAGMKIVIACMNIIWQCRMHSNLKFWALENPRGFLRQFLGIPYFTFEQWEYGDDGIKPTDIWGYFNKPKPTEREKPGDLTIVSMNGHTSAKNMSYVSCPNEYKHMGLNRASIRAITPEGFAKAFFDFNR